MAAGPASRLRLFLWLLVVTPLGFATKLYAGPLESWVRSRFFSIRRDRCT